MYVCMCAYIYVLYMQAYSYATTRKKIKLFCIIQLKQFISIYLKIK